MLCVWSIRQGTRAESPVRKRYRGQRIPSTAGVWADGAVHPSCRRLVGEDGEDRRALALREPLAQVAQLHAEDEPGLGEDFLVDLGCKPRSR